jgi:hypothetical protein
MPDLTPLVTTDSTVSIPAPPNQTDIAYGETTTNTSSIVVHTGIARFSSLEYSEYNLSASIAGLSLGLGLYGLRVAAWASLVSCKWDASTFVTNIGIAPLHLQTKLALARIDVSKWLAEEGLRQTVTGGKRQSDAHFLGKIEHEHKASTLNREFVISHKPEKNEPSSNSYAKKIVCDTSYVETLVTAPSKLEFVHKTKTHIHKTPSSTTIRFFGQLEQA